MSALPLLDHWKKLNIEAPALHIVLGSGLAPAFDTLALQSNWIDRGTVGFKEVAGLVASTAPGHKGVYRYYENKRTKKIVCFQSGRLHGYEGLHCRDVVRTVMEPMLAGTKKFLLTNAAGSLDPSFKVASLMIINDHVNLTAQNPLYGPNPTDAQGKPLGHRFPDMSQVYNSGMRERLRSSLSSNPAKFDVVSGVYLGLAGPTYETPAEVKLFSSWGLGSVGMSTVWEAIALRHAGATVAGLSFISNLGCGLGAKDGHVEVLQHEDVEMEVIKVASKLLPAFFDYAELEMEASS
ncbi:MAG: purine-nucleoside phosphorylase [Bdellovibrionales bacterium]|nr:purine-nucleoside phosphorylase [Bdellovibrionales bacterium]